MDEGCFRPGGVARLARPEACDLAALKVAKSGELQGAPRRAAVAEACGLGLLRNGLAASLHLYPTMDLLLPRGLKGPRFIAGLMVDGLAIEGAMVTAPAGPGLGARVREDKIRAGAIPL